MLGNGHGGLYKASTMEKGNRLRGEGDNDYDNDNDNDDNSGGRVVQ